MRTMRAMTTCVPVEFENDSWCSAVFFELGGVECSKDRNILAQTTKPVPISLEADLIERTTAAIVMLRFEVMTDSHSPLVGEVLVAPGIGEIQFQTVQNLTRQNSLDFYFADGEYNVIHSQQVQLVDPVRQGYKEILDDAISHDAVIRLTGRYNGVAAMKEVVANYATRVPKAS